jgi:uncharacterized protein involved in cysteine biosynthesis
MPSPLTLALGQIGDPAFRRPLWRGAAGAAAAFALLFWLALAGARWLARSAPGWLAGPALEWGVQALGAVFVLLLAAWLFVPLVVMIAGVFIEPVAAAVERRHYPGLPPPRGASFGAQAAWGVRFGLRLLLLHLVLLPFALLLPGVGAALAFLVASWGLGAGLFEGVAQRRLSVTESRALRRRAGLRVPALGAVFAALAAVPVLNLLVPVLGTAAATHLFHRVRDRIEGGTFGGNGA